MWKFIALLLLSFAAGPAGCYVAPRPYRAHTYRQRTTYTPVRGRVQVRGYTRRDGTYVRPHARSAPRRR